MGATPYLLRKAAGTDNAVTSPGDSDGDGLPDAWEIQYFGSINDPRATPNADPDGDGFTNLQEYLAGTDPKDPNSSLKFDSVTMAGSQTLLRFTAVASRTYTVLYRDDLSNGTWLRLQNVPGQPGTGPVDVTDSGAGASATRFYRIVTPALQ